KPQTKRREHPTLLDRAAAGYSVGRVEQRSRRRAEHDDRMVSFGCSHTREPAAGPREHRRTRDRNKPEIPLGKPLLEEQHRLRIGGGRILAENLPKTRTKLGVESRHHAILERRHITSSGRPLSSE